MDEKLNSGTPKRKYRTKHNKITIEDLEQLFGQRRKDAAKTLGVSVPTFKCYCRENGIEYWNGDACSHNKPELSNDSVHQNPPGSKPPKAQREKEVSALSGVRQDAVTVKAKYRDYSVRFQLPSGVTELKEAVAKRLELEPSDFHLMYQDEDKDFFFLNRR